LVIAWRTAVDTARLETGTVFMASPHRREQRREHAVDCRDELCRCLVGSLEFQHDRHLLVYVHARRVRESLRRAGEKGVAVVRLGGGVLAGRLEPADRGAGEAWKVRARGSAHRRIEAALGAEGIGDLPESTGEGT